MGKKELLVITTDAQKRIFQPLINALGIEHIIYFDQDKVPFPKIKENCILIVGNNSSIANTLFSKQTTIKEGVGLKVFKNPYNQKERILLLQAENLQEVEMV